MTRYVATIAIAAAFIAGLHAASASSEDARAIPKASAPPVRLLALTDEQVRVCQAEAQSLNQQLQQCGNDQQCRQRLQAAIQEHNARCR
jgi:hypothetical protein